MIQILAAEVLALGAVAALILLPWWQAFGGALLAIVGLQAVVNWAFPLVPMEEFGSPSDRRRAAWRFWLVAPFFLAGTLALLVAMLRG